MVRFMTTAFFGTCFADVSTYPANIVDELTTQTHKLCGSIANGGALHVQLYAFRHDGCFFFPQAKGRAFLAFGGAAETGFYTVLILLMIHI
jgi:hypothetical protein